jgi:gliding motility-associated-like protein
MIDSIRNGSGLYQISFSGNPGSFVPVQPGDTFGGFASGDLFFYIRDFKTGCVDSGFIFIPQPQVLTIGLSLLDTSSCTSSSGKVKIGPVSGGRKPYSYLVKYPDSLNTQAFSMPADSIITNLGEGTLFLTVSDSSGCQTTGIINIPVDRPLIGAISLTSPCIGDTNGIIRLSGMSGGSAPYTFFLLNSFGQQIISQSDSVFTGLAAGSYAIGIRDSTGAEGCENIYSRVLSPTAPMRFTTAKLTASTCENFDGEAVFALSGGQRPYQFSFDSLAGQFTPFRPVNADDTLKLRGLSARAPGLAYTLRIRDNGPDGGCFYDTTFIQPGKAPLSYQISKKDINCFGETTGSVTLNNIRGTGPLVIRVRRVGSEAIIAFDTLEGTFFQNSTFTLGGLPSGNFNFEVKQFGECNGSRSFPFSITEPAEVKIFARQFRKSASGFSLGSILLDSVNGGFRPYLMSFNGGAAFTFRADSLFRRLNPGEYILKATDSLGCEVETVIECEEDLLLFVPNLFTPNGDGLNDLFAIRNLPAGCRLQVKDRWGKAVFESENYQNSWDAKGEEAGTYFWSLEIPGQESKSGWVEVQR